MSSMMIAREEVYGPYEGEDQAEQERRRYEEAVGHVDLEAVVAVVTDHLGHHETSELREYIRQTLVLGEVQPYMPQPTALRICQQVARWVATAIDEQAQLVSLARRSA